MDKVVKGGLPQFFSILFNPWNISGIYGKDMTQRSEGSEHFSSELKWPRQKMWHSKETNVFWTGNITNIRP